MVVTLKGQEVGIKSIRRCLNNSLFTLRCDSAVCQHISASFQELAPWDEAWLAEDLACVLTFIGTTLGESEKETRRQRRTKRPWHHPLQVDYGRPGFQSSSRLPVGYRIKVHYSTGKRDNLIILKGTIIVCLICFTVPMNREGWLTSVV